MTAEAPVLTGFDLGYTGTAAAVEAKAVEDVFQTLDKQSVLEGCVAAFKDGRIDNLQAFMKGYMELKIGTLKEIKYDDGYTKMIAEPALAVLQGVEFPTQTAATLVEKMGEVEAQAALNVILVGAVYAQNVDLKTVEGVLNAGANPNSGKHHAIRYALMCNNGPLLHLLHKAGGDFAAAQISIGASLNECVRSKLDFYDAEFKAEAQKGNGKQKPQGIKPKA